MASLDDTQPLLALQTLQQQTAVLAESIHNINRDVDRLADSVNGLTDTVQAVRLIAEKNAQVVMAITNTIEKLEQKVIEQKETLDRHKWPIYIVMSLMLAGLLALTNTAWEAVKAVMKTPQVTRSQ